MSINHGWRMMLALASLWVAMAGCTKRNPDACCETTAECETLGFDSLQPCDLGACVRNVCTNVPNTCDGDEDCTDPSAPACVDRTCAACRLSTTCPATAPVCDATAHDCRACLKDSECDSLACDLAAGTCVDQAHILYTSPSGSSAEPCTRAVPCSLAKASSIVEPARPYIALTPGTYLSGPFFDAKTATVCGGGATILGLGALELRNGSNVTVRNLKVSQLSSISENAPQTTSFGTGTAIQLSNSTIALDNVQVTVGKSSNSFTIQGGTSFTITNSIFTNGPLDLRGRAVVDRSTFVSAPLKFSAEPSPLVHTIFNSLFLASPGQLLLDVHTQTTSSNTISISNNTFANGATNCDGNTNPIIWYSNIFFQTTGLQSHAQCFYYYNLMTTAGTVDGAYNISGDPQFVDAPNNDFHLKPGSPAIDTADPMTMQRTSADHDGVSRPQGARADIGAFEATP